MQSLRCLTRKNKPDSSICSPRDLASTIIPSRPISSGIVRRGMPIGPTRISITTIGHRCVFCHGRRWAFGSIRRASSSWCIVWTPAKGYGVGSGSTMAAASTTVSFSNSRARSCLPRPEHTRSSFLLRRAKPWRCSVAQRRNAIFQSSDESLPCSSVGPCALG